MRKLKEKRNRYIEIATKQSKGITLIALVVTIIVLIVLAGIAISMTVGGNGIFAKAREAKRLQITSEAKEKIGTEILDAQVEAIQRNEELEQAQVEDIISKYGTLQDDKDTIILKDNGYDIKLSDIYQGTITTSGSYTENKAKIELLEGQIKNLQEQLDKMTEENTKNKTEAENLRTEIESLKADVERQKELLESMSQSGDEKDKKIAELNEKIKTIENEKNELSNKNNELKNQNADLTVKAAELENLKTILGKVTASESQILKSYTAYKNGKLITGTMANYAGQTIQAGSTSSDDSYIYLTIPKAGYYDTKSKISAQNKNSNYNKISLGTKTQSISYRENKYTLTYSASSIENYKNLSEKNFCVSTRYGHSPTSSGGLENCGSYISDTSITYNSATGIVTVSFSGWRNAAATVTVYMTCYCIY